MKQTIVVLALAASSVAAPAQKIREASPQQQLVTTCNAEAKYRELTGESRNRYISGCLSNGRKRLQEVLMACNAQARGKGGEERRKFMDECLRR
ncbi:PsiF family protein [Ramlibacter alkalitolerans]|uniref:PsiF repeat protein n=1 Tax=Ramlibacter alkalitolerans TaxID=2039631 RepID=A0ABS1JIV2_9BURK|nr:PsiF family protein [Ramlibacter alkalitolerans]MBL0424132.1 PsiF repeat protein [Ramlibacter alkalitolerans]